MKNESTMKLTERYDMELLNLLSEDLKSIRPSAAKLMSSVTFDKQPLSIAS